MILRASRNQTDNGFHDYRKCLAKTGRDMCGNIIPGASVLEHALATGMVAEAMLKLLPSSLRFSPDDVNLPLIAALHDVGKVSPSFQWMITEQLDAAERDRIRHELELDGYIPLPEEVRPHHSLISCAALDRCCGRETAIIEGMHHGGLRGVLDFDGSSQRFGGASWQKARMELVREIEGSFGTGCGKIDRTLIPYVSGFVTVCDWLASSMKPQERIPTIQEAETKVAEAGFRRHGIRKGLQFSDIFGFQPRTGQTVLHSETGHPGIYVYEAAMGSGKTEAALYAAYRMLEEGMADGVYFALPTEFTAKQVARRMESFLSHILEGEAPGLVMAYGNAFLDRIAYSDGFPEPSWFEHSKRQLLAPFAVGTVDQAMMAVMNVRFSGVRMFGLAGKVVILDEIHSYDLYMGDIISILARRLEELGATVIILSATLRDEARDRILGIGSSDYSCDGYPLVTRRDDDALIYTTWDAGGGKEVRLEWSSDRNDAVDDAIDDAMDGKRVLWIENTVAEAQEAYRMFRARRDGYGTGLLHSRMLPDDRAAMEKECLRVFGKDSSCSTGYILVGTQILEQSLDLDADSMYSNLCPADMLIQRAGRLWRHQRSGRTGHPILHVRIPDMSAGIKEGMFGLSGAVYEPYVLYRTWKALVNRSSIRIPDEIREILDEVYSGTATDEVKAVRNMRMRMETKIRKMALLASSVLSSAGKTLPEEKVSTRYEETAQMTLLILRRIDLRNRSVVTCGGDTVSLDGKGSARERAVIAGMLARSSVRMPSGSCSGLPADDALASLFSPYVNTGGKEDGTCIAIALWDGSSRKLTDAYGNDIDMLEYTSELGLEIKR